MSYWDCQEASVNGVLGGYGHVSDDDITESRKFLFKVSKHNTCSHSIGRLNLVASQTCAECKLSAYRSWAEAAKDLWHSVLQVLYPHVC